jgi:hypothetical protein
MENQAEALVDEVPPTRKPLSVIELSDNTQNQKWHIEIPWYKTAIQGKENFVVFTLRVFYGDVKWTTDKRFSDCFKLSEDLTRKYEGVPEFPARQPKFLHDPKFLQVRQRELEQYFQSFEQAAFATDEMKNFLNAFTELHKLGIEIKAEVIRLRQYRSTDIYTAVVQVPSTSGYILPQRMTVIRLQTGELLLYAPVLLEDALHCELIRLGKVSYIVIPNKLHVTHLQEYLIRFPDAKLYVPPGIKEKIDVIEKGIVLQPAAESAWQDELQQIITVGNSFFTEVLYFHKRFRILIVGDLIINLPAGFFEAQKNQVSPDASVVSIISSQLFPPTAEDEKPMCSWEHQKYCTDAKVFSDLRESLLRLGFNSIIMVYGDTLDSPNAAQESLKSAFQVVINEVSERWGITNSLLSFVGSKK